VKKNKLPVEKAPSQQSPIPSQISMTGNNPQTLSKVELENLVGDLQRENQNLREQNANLYLRDIRFRMISKNSPDTILFQNKDLIYNWVINSTPLMAMEQVIGKTDFDLFSPEEANRFQTIKKELLINGQCHYEEIPFTQNNTVQYFSLFFQAWCDDNEEIIGITTYLHDITGRKKTEQELKQQLDGETLVAELSTQFINVQMADIEERIPESLQKMAEYLRADNGFIRFVDPINLVIQRGFEWKKNTNQGTPLETHGIPLDYFSWTKTQLLNNLPIFLQETSEITDEASNEREFLQKTGIKSMVVFPLFVMGRFVGYIGFSSSVSHPFWSEREKSLLELFRSTIVSVLERRDRENALHESQELYQNVIKLSPNCIFLVQEGSFLFTNPAGAHLLGFDKPEDIVGKKYEEIRQSDAIQEFREKAKQAVVSGRFTSVEISVAIPGRQNVNVELSGLPLKIQKKNAFLIVGIDITHRKAIEQEIEGNRRFLNDILNISPLAIFVYDREKNRMAYFNNATCDIFGYSTVDLGKLDQYQILHMVHPDDLSKAILMNKQLGHIAIGEVVEGDYRWMKPDGDILWLHGYQTAISQSEDGSTMQILTIIQNITEITKVQEELKASEDKYRGLLENIPGMVYQSLYEEPNTVLFISDFFEKNTSFSRNDVLEKGLSAWFDLVHPDDLEKLLSEIKSFKESSKPFEVEYRIRKANGEYIWVSDSGRVMYDENNKPLYVNGLVMDISARKRDFEAMRLLSQDNLRLLAQARRDSETKTLLLNEVNHRVKNNIASIIGLLELESQREIHSISEYQKALSDVKIRIGGLATVHDILSSNQWAPVQLELFIQKVIDNAASSSPIGRKITVSTYAQDKNLWINARQATALALILNELTTNSIKHAFSTGKKGTITITIRREEKDTNRVRIVFADNGPGWPEDILAGTGGNVGMEVIRLSAVSPLYGEIKFENHDGAVAIISFNLGPQHDLVKSIRRNKTI